MVVRVAPTDDVSLQTRLSDGDDLDSTDPAWCSDGARLAYVDPDDGNLWTIGVNTASAPATFGSPTLVYDASLPGNFEASHPTWSPDCSQLAFEADDDIWRIDADGTDAVALTERRRLARARLVPRSRRSTASRSSSAAPRPFATAARCSRAERR